MINSLPPWAAHFNAHPPFPWRNFPWYLMWTSPGIIFHGLSVFLQQKKESVEADEDKLPSCHPINKDVHSERGEGKTKKKGGGEVKTKAWKYTDFSKAKNKCLNSVANSMSKIYFKKRLLCVWSRGVFLTCCSTTMKSRVLRCNFWYTNQPWRWRDFPSLRFQ